MAGSIEGGVVYFPVVPDTSGFSRQLSAEVGRAATQASQTLQARLGSIGQGLSSVGRGLTAAITLPIVGIGVAAVKAAVNFESAFAGVRKTIDATEAQFGELNRGIREMAKNLPATREEIAKVAETAGQLGIRRESILEFTRTMIDLGESTVLTAEQAATAMAHIANVMRTPQDEIDRMGASLVALGNAGASSEDQILDLASRLAAAGKIVGLTEAQVLGFASALSDVGIEAEAGGTAFSKVFTSLAQATAKGGADLQRIAKIAGLTSAQFKQAFEKDAAGAIIKFVEGLGKVEESGGNLFQVLEDLGINEARLTRTLLSTATAGDLVRESVDRSSKAWQDNSALTEEANRRYATTASQWAMLKNRVSDVALTLGEAFLPILNKLVKRLDPVIEAVAKAAEWFSKLPDRVQLGVAAIAAFAAALGPILIVAGSIVSAVGSIATAVGALGGASVLAPAAGIAAGFAAAGTAAFVFRDQISEVVGDVSRKLGPKIRESMGELADKAKTLFSEVRRVFREDLQPAMDEFSKWWDENGDGIIESLDKIQKFMATWAGTILELWTWIVRVGGKLWETFGGDVLRFVGGSFGNLLKIVSGTLTVIQNTIGAWADLLTGNWGNLGNRLETITSGFVSAIGGFFGQLRDTVVFHWQAVLDALGVREEFDALKANVGEGLTTIRDTFVHVGVEIRETWDATFGALIAAVNDRFQVIAEAFGSGLAAIRTRLSEGLTLIRGVWAEGFEELRSIAVGAFEAFERGLADVLGRVSGLLSSVVGTWQGILSGLVGAFAGPINTIISRVLNPFLSGLRGVAQRLRLDDNINLPGPVPLVATHHAGGVVGESTRRTPMFPLAADEQIIKARRGERVLTSAEAQVWEAQRRSDAYTRMGDGPGLLGRVGGWIGGVVANVARPAVESMLSMVDRFAGSSVPGQLAGGGVRALGRGLLNAGGSAVNATGALGHLVMAQIIKAALPFAQITSGLRAGAITVSGNRSYHALGRAIDIAGSGSQMMAIFDWISRLFPNSAELIHTPAGNRQLKNGQRTTYGGAVAAQHSSHVHWALANGAYVTGPTRALIGESGPEFVAPEAKLEALFEKVLGRVGVGAPALNIETANFNDGADLDALTARVVPELERRFRASKA